MELRIRGIILGDDSASDIQIRDGRITEISSPGKGPVNFGSDTTFIIPPLFDIQVNGIEGIDLQSPNLRPEHVVEMTHLMVDQGVGYWVPTLITGPLDRLERACSVIAEAMQDPKVRRAVPGIHLEGPYISPLDGPRGAHARQYVRAPSIKEFNRLHKASRGKLLYVTLAPELPGAVPFIKHLLKNGVVAALGHHNASADDIARAVNAGAILSTHLGNGLASTINRHHNPLWPQLAEHRIKASVIADLEHLPADLLKVFFRAKGPKNIVLVSDCVHIAGLSPGSYELGGQAVDLLPSGRICLKGTDLLAGSSLMLLQGVVNAMYFGEVSLKQAVACATSIPARLLNVPAQFGRPRTGEKARFTAFDIVERAGRPKVHLKIVFY